MIRRYVGVVAVGILCLVPLAAGASILNFDDAGLPGGTITYGGTALVDPAVGTNILLRSITGVGTPDNAGATLLAPAATPFLLNFTTGPNDGTEGPPAWEFGGGGTFTVTAPGGVPAQDPDGVGPFDPFGGLPAGAVLLSGTFSDGVLQPREIGGLTSAAWAAFGSDTKNAVLAGYFGEAPDGWSFLNTVIQLTTFTFDPGTLAFSGTSTEADISNVRLVPMPASLLLLGAGFVAAGFARRLFA
jgi:hypothetical protein